MVHVYFGPNRFFMQLALVGYREQFIEKHGDFSVEQFDAEDTELSRINDAVQSAPFLTPSKLVIVKNIVGNKALIEDLERLIDSAPDTTELVIAEPRPDKRTSWYKLLKKATNFHEFQDLLPQDAAKWVQQRARDLGVSMSSAVAVRLVERVGPNAQVLSKALEKMSILDSEITDEMVRAHTERALQGTVFELLDATLKGQLVASLELYEEQRRQKVDPHAIWAMLLWQLHVLALVISGKKLPPRELAEQSGINPFVINKTRSLAGRLTLSTLRDLVHTARTIDVRLKNEAIDSDEAIRYVLTRMATIS